MLRKIVLSAPLIVGLSATQGYANAYEYSACLSDQVNCQKYTEENLNKFDTDYSKPEFSKSLGSNSTVLSKLVRIPNSVFKTAFERAQSYFYLRKLYVAYDAYIAKKPDGADRVEALVDFDVRLTDIVKHADKDKIIENDLTKKAKVVEIGATYIKDMLDYKMSICSDSRVKYIFMKLDEALQKIVNPSAANSGSGSQPGDPGLDKKEDPENADGGSKTDLPDAKEQINGLVEGLVKELDENSGIKWIETTGIFLREKAEALEDDLDTLFSSLLTSASSANVNSVKEAALGKLVDAGILVPKVGQDGQPVDPTQWKDGYSPENFSTKSAICEQGKIFLVEELKLRPWSEALARWANAKANAK